MHSHPRGGRVGRPEFAVHRLGLADACEIVSWSDTRKGGTVNTQNDSTSSVKTSRTTCVIAGAGPAGLVLGLLLARAGIAVTVLEKHADFLRDFRGDTVHPSTLELLDDLGLFERFAALPQSHLHRVALPGTVDEDTVLADFTRLPVRHPYIAMVPQWDLLTLLAEAAAHEPTFTLLTEHAVTGIVRDGDRVIGVEYSAPEDSGTVLADLTVACDGRGSVIRQKIGLPTKHLPVDFDVWWYRVPTHSHIGGSLLPRMRAGRALIAIPREGYLQIARLGRKGGDAALRARGLAALRSETADLLPEVADDVGSIDSLDEVKHLSVRIDRLRRWYAEGVLCIGDAAHAMSPVGGIGINLAVQDAVAAARLVAPALLDPAVPVEERILGRVQRRRALPTVLIQGVQRAVHSLIIMPVLNGRAIVTPRLVSRVLQKLPVLTAVPAYIVGIGFRPEKAPPWARRSTDRPRASSPAQPPVQSTPVPGR